MLDLSEILKTYFLTMRLKCKGQAGWNSFYYCKVYDAKRDKNDIDSSTSLLRDEPIKLAISSNRNVVLRFRLFVADKTAI